MYDNIEDRHSGMADCGSRNTEICDEIAKNCTCGRICKDKAKGHFRLAKANHSLPAANIRLARANDSLAAANHRNDHTKPLLKSS